MFVNRQHFLRTEHERIDMKRKIKLTRQILADIRDISAALIFITLLIWFLLYSISEIARILSAESFGK